MAAAVDLQEHAWLGEAGTAAAVLGRAVFPGSTQASLAAQAAQAGAENADGMVLGQDFSQVVVVVVPVDLLDQSQDLVAGGLGDAARRGAASIPMGQGRCPLKAIGTQQAAHMAQR